MKRDWKTVVINGKRKYLFEEVPNKDISKVRVPHVVYSSSQNRLCTASTLSSVHINSSTLTENPEIDCHSQSTELSQSLFCDDGNQRPEVHNDCEPGHSSVSQNIEVTSELAYATELSRLGMVTVVNNCAFVFPDFNLENKQIKVCIRAN